MELLSKLGIDWKILIAQLVNFGILAFVLTYYLYRPIIKVLEKRRNEIERNKNISGKMDAKLKEIEASKDKVLKDARVQSETIIKSAEKSAAALRDELLNATKKEQEKMIIQGQKRLEEERVKLVSQIKHDVGAVIGEAIERTVGDFVDEGAQKKLATGALRALEKAHIGKGEVKV